MLYKKTILDDATINIAVPEVFFKSLDDYKDELLAELELRLESYTFRRVPHDMLTQEQKEAYLMAYVHRHYKRSSLPIPRKKFAAAFLAKRLNGPHGTLAQVLQVAESLAQQGKLVISYSHDGITIQEVSLPTGKHEE